MNKILIIGNAGAGKSTFARQLSATLNLPLVHLDKLFWTGNWEHTTRVEFDNLLQKELEKPQWIIDGNFNRTIPHRLKYCDTVFYLDFPTTTCLWGITQRVIKHYGKSRSDMGGNCPEYFDANKYSLYKHVLQFNKEHRRTYYDLLSSANVNVIIFKNRRQLREYLKKGTA